MNYEVYITDAAERDLNEAVDYIEFVLLNPQAAESCLRLRTMPQDTRSWMIPCSGRGASVFYR